jgi:DHA1 family tetracycline resistance protein-like MFS transporter
MRKASLLTIFLIVFIDLVGFGILLPNQQYYGQTFGIKNEFFLVLIGPTYSLFQFLFAPILGRWSDKIGRRPVLLISQVGTLLGFLILYAAHFIASPDGSGPAGQFAIFLLYFSRVLDGISGGNISTASAYIADITTPENRAKGMGLIGAAFGLGFMFGPFIGGTVGSLLGLEYVPFAAAAFSLAALIGTYLYLPESLNPNTRSTDLRRFSLTGLRHAIARPVISSLLMMGFVNGFAFAGMEATFSLLIQERAALTPQKASGASGYLFGTIGVIIVLVQGMLIGPLTRAFGEARLVLIGPALIAAGLILVATAQTNAPLGVWPTLVLGSALLAVGSSLFTPTTQSLISRHTTEREQGEILGAFQGMASLARALGPMLAGILYWQISSAMPYYVSAAICILVCIWALVMQKKLVPPQVERVPVTV